MPFCSALSVDLDFAGAPDDLMTTFIDCLVLLPNLKSLEVFRTSPVYPFSGGLGRECVQFPSVRKLVVDNGTATLLGCCPNVESVVVADGLRLNGAAALISHGKELERLKHFVGVCVYSVGQGEPRDTLWSEAHVYWRHTMEVVQYCPNLQEICIEGKDEVSDTPSVSPYVEDLRGSHPHCFQSDCS